MKFKKALSGILIMILLITSFSTPTIALPQDETPVTFSRCSGGECDCQNDCCSSCGCAECGGCEECGGECHDDCCAESIVSSSVSKNTVTQTKEITINDLGLDEKTVEEIYKRTMEIKDSYASEKTKEMRSLYFEGKLSEDDWMKYQDERPEEEKYAKPYSQILQEVLSEYVGTEVAESVNITSSGNNVKSGCNHVMGEYYYTYNHPHQQYCDCVAMCGYTEYYNVYGTSPTCCRCNGHTLSNFGTPGSHGEFGHSRSYYCAACNKTGYEYVSVNPCCACGNHVDGLGIHYYDTAHPHAEYYECINCMAVVYTGNNYSGAYPGCSTCNPIHVHSYPSTWSISSTHSAGGHLRYKQCTGTGCSHQITDGYEQHYNNCTSCTHTYPSSWTISSTHTTENGINGHLRYKVCTYSGCNIQTTDGYVISTSCCDCGYHNYSNGPHYDSSHPHAEYYTCTRCGGTNYTGAYYSRVYPGCASCSSISGYYFLTKYGTNMRMNVSGSDDAEGTTVKLYTSDSTMAQKFRIVKESGTEFYKIYAVCSTYGHYRGLALSGNYIVISNNPTSWNLIKQSNGKYKISPQNSSLYINYGLNNMLVLSSVGITWELSEIASESKTICVKINNVPTPGATVEIYAKNHPNKKHVFSTDSNGELQIDLISGLSHGINVTKSGYLIEAFPNVDGGNIASVTNIDLVLVGAMSQYFTAPFSGTITVSSKFGWRCFTYIKNGELKLNYKRHNGIDIPKPSETPIYAICDGIVIQSDFDQYLGYFVTVNSVVNGTEYYTRYQHMFEDTKVGLGQLPDSHIVGQVGDTGEGSGNHLHIQVGIGSVNNVGDPARYFSYSY